MLSTKYPFQWWKRASEDVCCLLSLTSTYRKNFRRRETPLQTLSVVPSTTHRLVQRVFLITSGCLQTHSPSNTMRNSYNAYDSSNLHVDPYSTNSSHRSNSPTQVPEMFKKLNESHVCRIWYNFRLSFWFQLISPSYNTNSIPNKMRIKVIKANRLGKEVSQPFVNVEMDEPAQKYSTSKGINANPYWEESFDLWVVNFFFLQNCFVSSDLTPATEEILFEIYEGNDKHHMNDDEGFLGLAIVNFEEIRRSGETVHSLKLQGRPYRKDAISGDLTVQV